MSCLVSIINGPHVSCLCVCVCVCGGGVVVVANLLEHVKESMIDLDLFTHLVKRDYVGRAPLVPPVQQ